MTETDVTELIPAPHHMERTERFYELGDDFGIEAGLGTEGTARWLRATLGAATGLALPPKEGGQYDVLHLSVRPGLDAEAYRLVVAPHGVHIQGGSPAGVFWGAQTLRQLLGPDAFRRAPLPGRTWRLPLTEIRDAPDSAGAASCSTWPGTSCPRTVSCATWI